MRRPIALAAVAALVTPFWVSTSAAADDAPASSAAGGYQAGETVEGEVQRLVIDRHDLPSLEITYVVPADGEALPVEAGAVAGVAAGDEVSVVVETPGDAAALLGDPAGAAAVQEVEVLEESAQGTSSALAFGTVLEAPLVNRPVHLVTGTIGAQTADGVLPSALAADLSGTVSPYWVDSTNGAVSFTAASQISGVAYPGFASLNCTTGAGILELLMWSGTQTGATPGSGVHSVYYTPRVSGCGFAGVALLADGGPAWVQGGTTAESRRETMAHELGHTLGLGHSDSLTVCVDGEGADAQDGAYDDCVHGAYGDAYDVMGAASSGMGPLSGLQLDRLGLLSGSSVVRAEVGTTATLAPVGGLTGTRFLSVQAGERTYYVEYRAAVGRDSDLGVDRWGCPEGVETCVPENMAVYEPGVVVRAWMPTGYVDGEAGGEPIWISALLDPSWTDPEFSESTPYFVMREGHPFVTADGSLSIHLESVDASGATVRIGEGDEVVPPTPSPRPPYPQVVASNDLTGDGKSDVVTVDGQGLAQLHPGDGRGNLVAPSSLSGDWSGKKVYAPGDWSGDGRNDLMAVDGAGDLYLMSGNGRGLVGTAVKVGWGWKNFRIVPAGDMNGDGRSDLLAIDATGALWLYPGNGNGGFLRRIQVGNGWTSYALYAGGDMNKDGRRDILGISNGYLYAYFGKGGGYFQKRMATGQGWRGFVFASGSDFNGDGREDLMGKDRSGNLWFYAASATPGAFAKAQQIRTGW